MLEKHCFFDVPSSPKVAFLSRLFLVPFHSRGAWERAAQSLQSTLVQRQSGRYLKQSADSWEEDEIMALEALERRSGREGGMERDVVTERDS